MHQQTWGPLGAMVHEVRRNGGLGETIDCAPIP